MNSKTADCRGTLVVLITTHFQGLRHDVNVDFEASLIQFMGNIINL